MTSIILLIFYVANVFATRTGNFTSQELNQVQYILSSASQWHSLGYEAKAVYNQFFLSFNAKWNVYLFDEKTSTAEFYSPVVLDQKYICWQRRDLGRTYIIWKTPQTSNPSTQTFLLQQYFLQDVNQTSRNLLKGLTSQAIVLKGYHMFENAKYISQKLKEIGMGNWAVVIAETAEQICATKCVLDAWSESYGYIRDYQIFKWTYIFQRLN